MADGLAHTQEVGSSNLSPANLSVKQLLYFERYAMKHAMEPKVVKIEREVKMLNEIEKRIHDIIGGEPLVVWKIGMKYYELFLKWLRDG